MPLNVLFMASLTVAAASRRTLQSGGWIGGMIPPRLLVIAMISIAGLVEPFMNASCHCDRAS